jgi:aquaporin related protein
MALSNLIKRRLGSPRTGAIMGIPDDLRNHIVAAIAELAGTFLFLFFALSIVQVTNTPAPKPGSLPDTSHLLFIALGFGCSVAVNVWIFYRVSGGMFNPAVL